MFRQSSQPDPVQQLREKITSFKSNFDTGSISPIDQFNEMVEVLVALVISLNLTEDAHLNQFCKDLDTFTHHWVDHLNQFLAANSVSDINRIIADVRSNNIFMSMYKSIIGVDCSAVPEVAGLSNMLLPVWNQYFYQMVMHGYRKNGNFQTRESLLNILHQTDDAGLSVSLANELFKLPYTPVARSQMVMFQPATSPKISHDETAPAADFTFPITSA